MIMQWLHDFVSNTLLTLMPFWRDTIIFILSYAEGLPVIGSFVPGGTVAILIGSLAKESFISPWWAIHLIAIGSFLGDITGFFFGKQLKKIKRIKNFLEQEHHVAKWEFFDRHMALLIIFGKLLPVVRSMPSLFAGARGISKKKYVFYVLVGSYVWAVTGVFGGTLLVTLFGEKAIPIIIISVVAVVCSVWLYGVFRKIIKKYRSN